jgi:hypothetical protein
MNLLRYEFISGPDGSINGMLRKLVIDLRYNRSMVTIEEFKQAKPNLQKVEQQLQKLDNQIGQPHRNYIEEIMEELSEESDNETNLDEDLRTATYAMSASFLDQKIDFDDFAFSTGKAEHYHWLRFSGYVDQRPLDANLLIAKEVFRSICNKYNYIFIDLS